MLQSEKIHSEKLAEMHELKSCRISVCLHDGDSYRRFLKCSLVVGFFCQLWLLVNMSTLCLFIFCRFTCNMLELESLRPELTHDKDYMFQTVFCCHLHQPFNLSSKLLLLLDVICDVSIGAAEINDRIVDIY